MAIGGADGIGFDSSVPADTESASLGDDRIRSVKTSVQQVWDSEHNFPSGGGNSIGYHRFGSARPYYGSQSQVSSSGSDGRLMLTSDTSRLFAVGSGGTVFLGGPNVLSIGTTTGVSFPQRSYWAEEFGASTTDSSTGTVLITIPNSGYSGRPFVWITQYANSDVSTAAMMGWRTVDGQQFVARAVSGGGTLLGNIEFYWRSLGTRTL